MEFKMLPSEFRFSEIETTGGSIMIKEVMRVGGSYSCMCGLSPLSQSVVRFRLSGPTFKIQPDSVTMEASTKGSVSASFVVSPQSSGLQTLIASFYEIKWMGPKGAESLVELETGDKELQVRVHHGSLSNDILVKYLTLFLPLLFGTASVWGFLQSVGVLPK